MKRKMIQSKHFSNRRASDVIRRFCEVLGVTALLCVCLGCSGEKGAEVNAVASPSPAVVADSAPGEREWKLSFPTSEIYSDGTIQIVYKDFLETEDMLFFNCAVNNQSDIAYTVASRTVSVNGIPIQDGSFYSRTSSHGGDDAILSFSKSILRLVGIKEIRDIAIVCDVQKTEDIFDSYSTGIISLVNAAASSHQAQTVVPFEETVYETDAVRMTATSFIYAEDEPLYYLAVCFENRTKTAMTVSAVFRLPDSYTSMFNPASFRTELKPGERDYHVFSAFVDDYDMDAVAAGSNIAFLRATGSIGSVAQGWDTGEFEYNIKAGKLISPASQQTLRSASVDTVLHFPLGTLYTDDKLSIDYLGCDTANGRYRLTFAVANTSPTDNWNVVSNSVLVNGSPISTSISAETTAGSSVECTLDIFQSELDEYLISEIGEVTISCSAKLSEDSVYNYHLRPLILRNDTAGVYDAVKPPEYDAVLYDTDLVRITAVSGKVKSGADYATLMLCYENKIAESLTVFSKVYYQGETIAMDLDFLEPNGVLYFSSDFYNDDFGGQPPTGNDAVTLELIGQVSILESDTWTASDIQYHVLTGEFNVLPGSTAIGYQPGVWDHGVYTNDALGYSVSLGNDEAGWKNTSVDEQLVRAAGAGSAADPNCHYDLILENLTNSAMICAVYLDSTWRNEMQLYESFCPTGYDNGGGFSIERTYVGKRIISNEGYTFGKFRFSNSDGSGTSRYVLCRKIGDAAVVIYINAATDALADKYLSYIR